MFGCKTFRRIVFSLAFILFASIKVYAANDDLKLVVNGLEVTGLPVPPLLYQDSVLVPAREVFENLGARVDWHADERAVYIYNEDSLLIMTVDNETAYLDGEALQMQIPPLNVNGKIMIPLRFPSECFGFEVAWREEERTAYIYTPLSEQPIVQLPEDEPIAPPAVSDGLTVLARDISKSVITVAAYPETSITALLTPRETQTAAYTIVASSPISEVQTFLLPDNRLVVDIYNAQCGIWGPFYVDTSCPVSGVRASQFMETPRVTRVVFDVVGAAEYSISLTGDRTALSVSFTQNIITGVVFSTTGVSDTITITGTSTPVLTLFPMSNPNRLMVYIANATMAVSGNETTGGAYMTRLSYYQQADGAGCVEAQVHAFSSYDVEYGVNTAIVRFYPNTYQNINYDRISRVITIPKSSGLTMDVNAIRHSDDYPNLTYTLVLPVDAETAIGYGELLIHDGYIQSIKIARDAQGLTSIIINEARVLAFKVYENADYYYIQACLPKEAYSRIVIIDPGHGGVDPGTVNYAAKEKDINLSITSKLMMLLDDDPTIKAYATRLTDITFPREDRPFYANGMADLYVSIHVNSAPNNNQANGIETWYWPHTNDAVVGFSCYRFAQIMHKNMISGTGASDRSIKSDELIVLRDTTIPAVLCETGFLTNAEECAKLLNETYQWQLAFSLYQGICEAFSVYTPKR